MKILIFGMLVEDVGSDKVEIEVSTDTESLMEFLLNKYPALRARQFMIAVNKQKVNGNIALNPNDEIALIPPFAGG